MGPALTLDSTENIKACLDCPLPEYTVGLGRTTRKKDEKIRDMFSAGWSDDNICRSLGIMGKRLEQTKIHLNG